MFHTLRPHNRRFQRSTRLRRITAPICVILFIWSCGCGPAAGEKPPASSAPQTDAGPSSRDAAFDDPAPPTVRAVKNIPPPEPKPHDRVTFHSRPKPLAQGAVTHDWTTFLGPTHNAVSTETHLLDEFPPEGPPLVWELSTGSGYSSPAIQGERLVYSHRLDNETLVECLHPASGQLYWQFKFGTEYSDRYGYNNGPRASPVIHRDRVFIYSVEGKLFCLQLETGQLVWSRDLAAEFKIPQNFFGVGTTPLLEGDRLIINVGAPQGPEAIAIDAVSGRIVWGSGNQWGPSYASPVPATIHGKRRVFVFAGGESEPPAGGLLSLDPVDGSVDFRFPWRSRSYESVNAACPVVVGNRVFISASYRSGGACLTVNKDFTHDVAWTSDEIGTHWNTAVHDDGHLYAFDGRNEPDAALVCVNLETGKTAWREVPEWDEVITLNGEKQTLNLSTLRGCLLKVDGRFLCLGELGHLLWLDLSPDGYKELSRARLFLARETWALPVLSRGLLYVSQNQPDILSRKRSRLLCYDLRGE